MPAIFELDGIRIEILYDEHNPPHFHVVYAGVRASFRIDNGKMIAGDKLPLKQRRKVRKFIKKYRNELMDNWKRSEERKPLCEIKQK